MVASSTTVHRLGEHVTALGECALYEDPAPGVLVPGCLVT